MGVNPHEKHTPDCPTRVGQSGMRTPIRSLLWFQKFGLNPQYVRRLSITDGVFSSLHIPPLYTDLRDLHCFFNFAKTREKSPSHVGRILTCCKYQHLSELLQCVIQHLIITVIA